MKAIRVDAFGPPSVMRIQDVSLPQPADDEVLVQIKAAGVNPVDTYIRAGGYGPKKFPFTPGFDAAGLVLQVGRQVKRFSPGQRVFVAGSKTGTYAEQALCKASCVYPLPDAAGFEQGAAIGVPYKTAWHALFHRANAVEGETVLVHGASGGVGLAAIQLAKSAGLKVIATAGSDSGRQIVTGCGADYVLDHHDNGHFEKILEWTEGRGVEVILEMLANVNLAGDLKIAAKYGRVAVIGSRGPIEIDPREIMSREATVLGVMSSLMTTDEKAEAFACIEAGLQNKTLRPVIAQQFPLDEAPQAHTDVMEAAHHGKIVLIP